MAHNPNRRSVGFFNTDQHSLANFEFSFSQTLESNASPEILPDTQSVTESVLNYRVENGRTYHAYKDGGKSQGINSLAYFLPNDQEEIERLQLLHEIFRRTMGNVGQLAPWTDTYYPRRVLDVATGTGDWVFDFAYEYPQTELIIGTDLSNIQPDETPPNVVFLIDDSSQEWLDDDLDYVHTRNTNGCFENMLTQVIQQAFDKLNPGGWLECQEPEATLRCDDGTMPADHALLQWLQELGRISRLADKPCEVAQQLKGWFEQVGFVDVQEKVYKMPTCAWPEDHEQKEIGWWMEEMLASHVSGISRAYQSRVGGLSVEEHELSLIPVRRDLRNRNYHTYMALYVVTGRKPGSNTDRYNLKLPQPVSRTGENAEEEENEEGIS